MSRKSRQLSSGISTLNLRAVLTLLAVVTIGVTFVYFNRVFYAIFGVSIWLKSKC